MVLFAASVSSVYGVAVPNVDGSCTDADLTTPICDDGITYRTIQGAIDSVSSGTINVAAGTYAENVVVNGKENMIIQGSGNGTVVEPATGIGFALTNSNTITIKNLKIHTTGEGAHGIWVAGSSNGADGMDGLTVQDATIIVDGYSSGIYAAHSNPAHSSWLIGGSGHGNHIIINKGTGVTGDGLDLYDVSASEVSYNDITLNNPTDSTNVLWFSELSSLNNIVFSHNSVSGSSGSEVAIVTDFIGTAPDTSISGVTIEGNTFRNWGSRALRLGTANGAGAVTGITINSNTFEMTADKEVIGGTATDKTGTGNTFNVNSPAKIQKAIDSAFAGDMINVAAGTYTENLAINKGLTIDGAGASSVTINGAHTITSNNVALDGMTFATVGSGTAITIDSSSSTINNADITNSIFTLTTGPSIGVHIGGGTPTNKVTDIRIESNTFNGPTDKVCNPIKIGGQFGSPLNAEIENVDFISNTVNKCSMPINLQNKNINDILINGNTFRNTDGVMYVWGEGNPTGELSDFVFTNNDVDSTNSYGVGIDLNGATVFDDSNFGAGNKINDNRFVGIPGLYGFESVSILSSLAGYKLDAQNNYWGASNPDFNTVTSGSVDYTPWYLDSGLTQLSGQPSCTPEATETTSYGTDVGECSAGIKTRTCTSGGIWGDWQVTQAEVGAGFENSTTAGTCSDGKDNDCDGYTDSFDSGCSATPDYYTKTELQSTTEGQGSNFIGYYGTWVHSTVEDALDWLYSNTLKLTDSFSGDVSGTYNNLQISTNAIGANELADNAVDTAAIQNDAVTALKIAAGAVGASEIGTGVVSSDEIADGSVTNADLAGSIAASNLVSTDIVTVGTITSGTWNGAAVDVAHGGTGATTQAGARTNLELGSLATLNTVGNAQITDIVWSKVSGAPSFLTSETDPVWTADKTNYATTAGLTSGLAGKQDTLTAGSITEGLIAAGAVTDGKISDVSASKLTGTIDDARIPASIARDTEITNAVGTEATARSGADSTLQTQITANADSITALGTEVITSEVKTSLPGGTLYMQRNADSSGRVRLFRDTLGNPLFNIWGYDAGNGVQKPLTLGVFNDPAFTEAGNGATARAIITSGGNGATDRNALELQSPSQVRITAVDDILQLGNVRIASDTYTVIHSRTDAETDAAKYLIFDTVGDVQGANPTIETNAGNLALIPAGGSVDVTGDLTINGTSISSQITSLENRALQNTDGIYLYLTQGWNKFKLPWFVLIGTDQVAGLDVADYDVATVLAGIEGSYSYLAYYDGAEWQTYVPGDEEATTFMQFPTDATSKDYDFHIYMSEGARLTIPVQGKK